MATTFWGKLTDGVCGALTVVAIGPVAAGSAAYSAAKTLAGDGTFTDNMDNAINAGLDAVTAVGDALVDAADAHNDDLNKLAYTVVGLLAGEEIHRHGHHDNNG